jgi:hypothetical protein
VKLICKITDVATHRTKRAQQRIYLRYRPLSVEELAITYQVRQFRRLETNPFPKAHNSLSDSVSFQVMRLS